MDNLWIWLMVYEYPFEKYDFVSWDDDILRIWEKSMFQTTNQEIPDPRNCGASSSHIFDNGHGHLLKFMAI